MNTKLYNELLNLRQDLQNKSLSTRTKICDDEVLELLVRYKPVTKEDMLKISGIGNIFVNNYGDLFIDIIKKYTNISKCDINENEKIILQKLENRLVDINQRNRLLYSSKINKDYTLDLVKLVKNVNEVEEFITKQLSGKIKIIDTSNIDDTDFKNVLKLIRQVNKIEVETGNNELFITYPFVQGKLEQEDFMIKAPLMLYPVELIRNNDGIYLKNDTNREILYNTTLILANNKFNGKNLVLPSNEIEEYNVDNYFNDMISFYTNNNLYINNNECQLEKFLENKYSEFPKYKSGYLEIKKYMVLGIYSTYVTSMYEDFEKMIKNEDITKLIKELLVGEKLEYKDIEEVEENNLYYINELDYAQEKALSEIENNEALVIQGPPGTGKSQTITSIIVQSILNNKKVLMVSEKKTALDVIYSRLGNLSKYSIMIDDVKNKNYFYDQINNIISSLKQTNEFTYKSNESIKTNINEIKEKITNIDKDINYFKEISKKIYEINDFDCSIYDLYSNSTKLNLLDMTELKNYKFLKQNLGNISYYKYPELTKLKDLFNEKDEESLIYYMNIRNNKPYLLSIKTNLSESEIIDFRLALQEVEEEYKKFNSYSSFKKLFNKKELKSKQDLILKYFDKLDYTNLENNIENIKLFLTEYDKYISSKFKYDELSINEKEYLNLIIKVMSLGFSFKDSNKYIYNTILYEKINEFEKNNLSIINYINNFDSIRENIKKNIIEKRELTKKLAYNELLILANDLNGNNKLSKIEEVVNRKRKMSVTKFMEKFKLELFDSIKIWLMTPEVVSDVLPFEKNLFDLVIFDEASQLYVEKAIPAIYRTKKVIVAGDQKQLKPSSLGKGRILDEIDEEEITDGFLEYESLLDAARYKYKHTMLNYHYRSKYEELIAFSNTAFYENKLLVMANYPYDGKPIERIKVNGSFIDKKNIEEANEVVRLVKEILNNRKNNETFGVITFNSSQMNLIEDLIEKEKSIDSDFSIKLTEEEHRTNNGENIGFFVKNIETVQGDERDIIIFCIGYAKGENGKVNINFGWLNQDGGENRLNVAISRAKQKVYVITSIEPEELEVNNTKNNGPKLFREYLRYAKAVSEGDKNLIESILLPLTSENKRDKTYLNVANKLIEKGYNIETDYGVTDNKIDIVVKDKTGTKNILGIECDKDLYDNYKVARERDYHRQKYLETRGFTIYRIWTPNWWKNSEIELNKLTNYIDSLDK